MGLRNAYFPTISISRWTLRSANLKTSHTLRRNEVLYRLFFI